MCVVWQFLLSLSFFSPFPVRPLPFFTYLTSFCFIFLNCLFTIIIHLSCSKNAIKCNKWERSYALIIRLIALIFQGMTTSNA